MKAAIVYGYAAVLFANSSSVFGARRGGGTWDACSADGPSSSSLSRVLFCAREEGGVVEQGWGKP